MSLMVTLPFSTHRRSKISLVVVTLVRQKEKKHGEMLRRFIGQACKWNMLLFTLHQRQLCHLAISNCKERWRMSCTWTTICLTFPFQRKKGRINFNRQHYCTNCNRSWPQSNKISGDSDWFIPCPYRTGGCNPLLWLYTRRRVLWSERRKQLPFHLI